MQHTDMKSFSFAHVGRIGGRSIREARYDLRYFSGWKGAPWLGSYIDEIGYKRKDFSDQIKAIWNARPETGNQGKAISERISEKR